MLHSTHHTILNPRRYHTKEAKEKKKKEMRGETAGHGRGHGHGKMLGHGEHASTHFSSSSSSRASVSSNRSSSSWEGGCSPFLDGDASDVERGEGKTSGKGDFRASCESSSKGDGKGGYSVVSVKSTTKEAMGEHQSKTEESSYSESEALDVDEGLVVSIFDALKWLRMTDDSTVRPSEDSHYRPVHPEDYVAFRMDKAVKFYKSRIPLCNRTRHIIQGLSTLGSVASVVLSFLGFVQWTVVTAIAITGLMAWLEFQGTNNKIIRYSNVVDTLESHKVWWNTRPSIEKSVVHNIERLVGVTEEVLRDEANVWSAAASTQSNMLASDDHGNKKLL